MLQILATILAASILFFPKPLPLHSDDEPQQDLQERYEEIYEIDTEYFEESRELVNRESQQPASKIKENEIEQYGENVQETTKEKRPSGEEVSTNTIREDNGELFSSSEIDLLSRLVTAEARNEPYVGKVAVAEVVMNRMNSEEFPDTLEGVVYQSGQFQVVSNGTINEPATDISIQATKEAINGSNYSQGALFFYNSAIATDRWLDTLKTITVIGQHTFK